MATITVHTEALGVPLVSLREPLPVCDGAALAEAIMAAIAAHPSRRHPLSLPAACFRAPHS